MTVMDTAGLKEEGLPSAAVEQRTAAMELLHTLFGQADQITVVPVRIVGAALKMRPALPRCQYRHPP